MFVGKLGLKMFKSGFGFGRVGFAVGWCWFWQTFTEFGFVWFDFGGYRCGFGDSLAVVVILIANCCEFMNGIFEVRILFFL